MRDKIIRILWRRRTAALWVGPIVMLFLARPNALLWYWSIPLIVAGEFIRFWAAGHLNKNNQVITSGPFGYVRNPLYIGSFLIFCGMCVMTNRWEISWIFLGLFLAFHTGATMFEEEYLFGLFGSDFTDYCKKVPRLIPQLRSIGGKGRFSFRLACSNREPMSGAFTLFLVALYGLRATHPDMDLITALIHIVIG